MTLEKNKWFWVHVNKFFCIRDPSLTRHTNNGIRTLCRFSIIRVHPIKISAWTGLVKVLLGLHMLHNAVLAYDPGTKAARKAGHRRQRRTAHLICTISDEDYDYETEKSSAIIHLPVVWNARLASDSSCLCDDVGQPERGPILPTSVEEEHTFTSVIWFSPVRVNWHKQRIL